MNGIDNRPRLGYYKVFAKKIPYRNPFTRTVENTSEALFDEIEKYAKQNKLRVHSVEYRLDSLDVVRGDDNENVITMMVQFKLER